MFDSCLETCVNESVVCGSDEEGDAAYENCDGYYGVAELHGVVAGIRYVCGQSVADLLRLSPYGKAEYDGGYPKPEVVDDHGLHVHRQSLRLVLSEEGCEELLHPSEVVEIEESPAHDYEEDAVDVESDLRHPFPA